MSLLEFKNVDIVFGDNPESAFPYIDEGLSRTEIGKKQGKFSASHKRALK